MPIDIGDDFQNKIFEIIQENPKGKIIVLENILIQKRHQTLITNIEEKDVSVTNKKGLDKIQDDDYIYGTFSDHPYEAMENNESKTDYKLASRNTRKTN